MANILGSTQPRRVFENVLITSSDSHEVSLPEQSRRLFMCFLVRRRGSRAITRVKSSSSGYRQKKMIFRV
jgi:hypothetical protein